MHEQIGRKIAEEEEKIRRSTQPVVMVDEKGEIWVLRVRDIQSRFSLSFLAESLAGKKPGIYQWRRVGELVATDGSKYYLPHGWEPGVLLEKESPPMRDLPEDQS